MNKFKAIRGKKRKRLELQLTSLLDMFTIILVFLMVNFQADDMDFVLNPGLSLPTSTARNPFKTAVNLAIQPDGVLVEGQKVYALSGGKALEADLARGKVDAITTAVKAAWDGEKREPQDNEEVVVVQADKSLPYKTIHLVMRSAAHAGFFRFRLVVEKE